MTSSSSTTDGDINTPKDCPDGQDEITDNNGAETNPTEAVGLSSSLPILGDHSTSAAAPINGNNKRHKPHVSPTRPLPIESTFVTPNIFRRKLNKRTPSTPEQQNDKQLKETENDQKNMKKLQQFRWSIDQMSIIRPAQIDESELSLPPEDWDPSAEHNGTHPSIIEQFWTRNTHIVPSPDVLPMSGTSVSLRQQIHGSTAAIAGSPYQSITFCSPSFPGQIPASSSSSATSRTDSSPYIIPNLPAFESTRINYNKSPVDNLPQQFSTTLDNDLSAEAEFEQIENSLSIGIDSDEILADLGDESGGFIRRRSNENEKIENGSGVTGEATNGSQNSSSGIGGSNASGSSAWIPPFYVDASPIKSVRDD